MLTDTGVLRIFLAAFLLLLACSRAQAKPNLVIILVDDMGYGDIGRFGSKLNRTPNCDRMATEGMRLTSLLRRPVCTPSRAQILTGCYAKRVSLPDVIFPAAEIGLSARSTRSPKLLKEQGYATQCIGKWHVGDQPEFLPTHRGFDHYLASLIPTTWAASGTARRTCRRTAQAAAAAGAGREVIETLNGAKQDRHRAITPKRR